MKAFYLHDGYGIASKDRGLDGWYRELTVAEAKAGKFGNLYAKDGYGRVREVRLNGKVKTWKTWAGCEMPMKYGLRRCFRVGDRNLLPEQAVGNVMVKVNHPFDPDVPASIVADWVMDNEMG